jgi:hypothetical protein
VADVSQPLTSKPKPRSAQRTLDERTPDGGSYHAAGRRTVRKWKRWRDWVAGALGVDDAEEREADENNA